MNESERAQIFLRKHLEQALMQAASHFGVRPDELAYKQLEKKHGFLRKRRGVIIEVDPEVTGIGRRRNSQRPPHNSRRRMVEAVAGPWMPQG